MRYRSAVYPILLRSEQARLRSTRNIEGAGCCRVRSVRCAAAISKKTPKSQEAIATGTRREINQSIDCNSLPGLNLTALPGGIETSAPVRGLRPMPVFRGRTLNTPNPRSSIRLPRARAFFMLSKTVSTAISALVLVIPVFATTSLMISSLITSGSRMRRQNGASSA